MDIIHVTAECFPVAKAGGLGDVAGALPKYQAAMGHFAKVVMPMYRTKFLYNNEWELVHEGGQNLGSHWFHYSVIKEKTNKLGFDLYLVDINGLLDREMVYGYSDDTERFIAFQIAVADWLNQWQSLPSVVHCHDHHTGLLPFMMKYCYAFRNNLAHIPTVFTIHNGQYQGQFGWDKYYYLPGFDSWQWGLLDWNDSINPMASAVKCVDRVSTVSYSYMDELKVSAAGLENLFEYEKGKCIGILNGIDTKVWDPATDTYLQKNYSFQNCDEGKQANKEAVCSQYGLDATKPLFVFIGRLVGEKSADLLPGAIRQAIYQYNGSANFMILGSGDPQVESQLSNLANEFPGFYNAYIGYSEPLSHLLYAGADFLLMPSRVEPCGLNQMYALRYGTVPIVRNVGGLRDTIVDMGEWEGFGIRHDEATEWDIVYSIGRGIDLYYNKPQQFEGMRNFMMQIDHSWDYSAQQYLNLYYSIM